MQVLRSSYVRPGAIKLYSLDGHLTLCSKRSNAAAVAAAGGQRQLRPLQQQQQQQRLRVQPLSLQACTPLAAHSPAQPAPSLLFGRPANSRAYACLPERSSTTSHRQVTTSASNSASWGEKLTGNVRESLLLAYTTLVETVLVSTADVLQLNKLLYWATPKLEQGYSTITGKGHVLADGRRIPYSLVNNTAPGFDAPSVYSPADFPFSGPWHPERIPFQPNVAHFMSLCMKLVYEQSDAIEDICTRGWGLQHIAYLNTGGFDAPVELYSDAKDKAAFTPHTRVWVGASQGALICSFRGSEPTNLINFRSSGRIELVPQEGMGRVHAGFWSALFHGDAEGGTLYKRLVDVLNSSGAPDRPIFLTGHSMGGALTVIFAQALAENQPHLAARIRGVYAFASPRVGDAEFAKLYNERFRGYTHRMIYSADIVPRVPPEFLQYSHVGGEHYINAFGTVHTEPAAIKRWHMYEGVGFIPFYLYKIVQGLASRKESALRSLYRIVLFVALPGLSDHWPADYELQLRRHVRKQEA